MSKTTKTEIRLGRLELRIMSVVWDLGKASVHDVRDNLSGGKKPAYSTILTMMRKIEAKGYLKHDVKDRTFIYRATISRQDARQNMVGDILDRVFDGSASLLMTSLVEQGRVNKDELDKIRKLLNKRRKKNG